MHLVPVAITFAVASLIPVAAPQQPLQASLGIGYRTGKIDFKLAAVAADMTALRAAQAGASEPLEEPMAGIVVAVGDDTAASKPLDPSGDATRATASRPLQQKPAFDGGVQVADGAAGSAKDATVAVADAEAAPVPIPIEPKLAGSPALLVVAASAKLTYFFDGLPPLLTDGIVLEVGALDAAGTMIVSRYATDFPGGIALYAQSVMLVDGQLLASEPKKFEGAGRDKR